MKRYCSICLKPCETYDHYEKIDDEFGVQVHGPFLYSKCCQEEALTREEWAREVQENWNFRRAAREHYNEKPLTITDVLSDLQKIMRAA